MYKLNAKIELDISRVETSFWGLQMRTRKAALNGG